MTKNENYMQSDPPVSADNQGPKELDRDPVDIPFITPSLNGIHS